jgi:hypothetical protein
MTARNESGVGASSDVPPFYESFENLTWPGVNENASNSSSLLSSDQAAVSEFWLNDPCKSFEFFHNTILLGALCIFGIATNVLSIAVLQKDRHNRVATFLLRSLAVADIAELVVVFVILSIFFGTAQIPGVIENFTGFAIPYLKKVGAPA